jgi:proteasome lid subunit RPN8/RPN11
MLEINRKHLKFIEADGEKHYPNECCGLIAGYREKQSWTVQKVIPIQNELRDYSSSQFRINPQERNQVEKQLDKSGLELIGFYHSHPDHGVYFSETDLKNSEEFQFGRPWIPPTYAYLIVSIIEGKSDDYGAFIVKEGQSEKIVVDLKEKAL